MPGSAAWRVGCSALSSLDCPRQPPRPDQRSQRHDRRPARGPTSPRSHGPPPGGPRLDTLSADGTRSVQTSTTNIGAYLWSALVAERLGLISHAETVARLSTTIGTLEHMERYQPGGQFYNWYDHRMGAKLTVWPPTGAPLTPILSSVDHGWLVTGLRLVQRSVPGRCCI